MTDYQRGVEQASAVYQEIIHEYVAENAKLRELLAQRTARRVIVSNAGTDHATGRTACGACGGAIGPWDAWCRHCGARLEDK